MKKIILKALSGPIQGQVFVVKNRLLLGRLAGDVILQDNNSSNPHAEINVYDSGTIMLTDRDSKNGVFVNGVKKDKTVLEHGSRFTIASIMFEILKIKPPEDVWSQILIEASKKIKDKDLSLQAFHTEIYLKFLEGPHKGRIECLAYGPRSFGSDLVEGAIFDKAAKAESFTIIPTDKEIMFQTSYPNEVLLNEKSKKNQIVKDGDIITLGKTTIKLQFNL